MACAIAGDETKLAQELRVPVSRLVGWLLGDMEVPTDTFLKALDIVLANTKVKITETRAMLEEIKRRRSAQLGEPLTPHPQPDFGREPEPASTATWSST